MEIFITQYGELSGVKHYDLYENGSLKQCVLGKLNILKTNYGDLIPQYDYVDVRKKYINSLTLFTDGSLERISLNAQTIIDTPIGKLPLELITFHPNGSICRAFPLNGQLSAYWDEDQEFKLSTEIPLNFSFGSFTTRITSIFFYENASVKGLSLWAGNIITIDTPLGRQDVRVGLSIHQNGNLKSFEPATPLDIETSIGVLTAFDASNDNLFKDDKSVSFHENGSLHSIITSIDKVTVTDRNNIYHIYEPNFNSNILDNEDYIYPLRVSFNKDKVTFNNKDSYSINECSFEIERRKDVESLHCTECINCNNCSTNSLTLV